MVKTKYFVIHIISCAIAAVGFIASLVNFILFLVKDTPFNWIWVVILLLGGFVAAVNTIFAIVDVKRWF